MSPLTGNILTSRREASKAIGCTPLNGTTGYGGKTDGPYFGLVERKTDPAHPSKSGFRVYAVFIAIVLMIALAAILMIKRPSLFRKHG